ASAAPAGAAAASAARPVAACDAGRPVPVNRAVAAAGAVGSFSLDPAAAVFAAGLAPVVCGPDLFSADPVAADFSAPDPAACVAGPAAAFDPAPAVCAPDLSFADPAIVFVPAVYAAGPSVAAPDPCAAAVPDLSAVDPAAAFDRAPAFSEADPDRAVAAPAPFAAVAGSAGRRAAAGA